MAKKVNVFQNKKQSYKDYIRECDEIIRSCESTMSEEKTKIVRDGYQACYVEKRKYTLEDNDWN